MTTLEAAKGKWRGILAQFGFPEKFLRNRHTECPLCGGKDRYRFDDKDGTGSYYCSGCGPGFGFQLLERFTKKEKRDLLREIDLMVGNIQATESPRRDPSRVLEIGKHLIPAAKCEEVLRYIRARGLSPVKSLQAHPSMAYYEEGKKVSEFPAMVLPFVSQHGELVTYHVTYVKEGEKAPVGSPKKILTPITKMDGGCLRLTKTYERIGIAEGVETALAVMRKFEMPCWAATSAGMLEKFMPPDGIKAVTVFGDNDKNFTGQKVAYTLANRLAMKGMAVDVKLPETHGDFADV